MFDNLTIGKRLAIAFSALAVLILVTGAFAVQRMGHTQATVRSVTLDSVPSIRDLGRLATMLAEYRVSERGLVASADDPAKQQEYAGELAQGSRDFNALAKSYEAKLADARDRALYEQVLARADRYFDNSRQVIEGVKSGDTTAAKRAGDLRQATADAVAALLDYNLSLLDKAVAAQESSYRFGVGAIAALLAIALALAATAAILISRSIVRPLRQVVGVANAVARGDLDVRIASEDRSEVGEVSRAMRGMVASLRDFAQAQAQIEDEHAAGAIDFRIDASRFPGAYGRMAEGINALVASHIAVKMRVVEVVSQYARGDLSTDIERYPGQKARITEAVDAVKAGMLAVNAEIKQLVDAAVAGDFSQRGDARRFEHVYAELVERLNTLMATADRGLTQVGEVLASVADGDLSRRIDTALPGRFGTLAADTNRTVAHLTDIVGQIRGGSESINAAAVEIARGNEDLSRRTEQQAASLEETASSMEELTATVKQNADSARQASQLARGAAEIAAQGGEVVGEVVRTMGGISASSRRIADIIGVIDGIAFQTNILALNAAVEAARAGEQGRGFAVVAAEVRSLAQRSAGAAKEIKQLITDSVVKVEEGSALVDKAGRTMTEIVGSVKRVTDIMADISAASQEQSSGIEQVNQAITQMDEGTQQNAALVEEASAAAQSLEQQADQLVRLVAAFRLQATSQRAPLRDARQAA